MGEACMLLSRLHVSAAERREGQEPQTLASTPTDAHTTAATRRQRMCAIHGEARKWCGGMCHHKKSIRWCECDCRQHTSARLCRHWKGPGAHPLRTPSILQSHWPNSSASSLPTEGRQAAAWPRHYGNSSRDSSHHTPQTTLTAGQGPGRKMPSCSRMSVPASHTSVTQLVAGHMAQHTDSLSPTTNAAC